MLWKMAKSSPPIRQNARSGSGSIRIPDQMIGICDESRSLGGESLMVYEDNRPVSPRAVERSELEDNSREFSIAVAESV